MKVLYFCVLVEPRGFDIRKQIVDMAMNGSGIRDTARVLKISPITVIEDLKKSPHTESP